MTTTSPGATSPSPVHFELSLAIQAAEVIYRNGAESGHNAILGDSSIRLPEHLSHVPAQIVLGIRPEHIQIADSESEDLNTIHGRVSLVENLGMHYLVSVEIHHNRSIATILRVLIPSDRSWNRDSLSLTLPPQHIHWFDPTTCDSLLLHH